MSELIIAVIFAVLLIGTPIFIVESETTKAVNKTTVECIETPNVCKMRYEYMKLGDKLRNVELDELEETSK